MKLNYTKRKRISDSQQYIPSTKTRNDTRETDNIYFIF